MQHNDNCINEFDSSALDEVTALEKIIKAIKSIKKTEDISIKNSYNRILAENIKARSIYQTLIIQREKCFKRKKMVKTVEL